MGCTCCTSCCNEYSFQNGDANTPFNNSLTNNNSNDHSIVPFGIGSSSSLSDNSRNRNRNNNNYDDDIFSFTPYVRVKKVRNGVIGCQITNLLQISSETRNCYNDWSKWQFEFSYKFIHQSENGDNIEQKDDEEIKWKSVMFKPDRITQNGMFYIKIKLYLNDYEVHCRIRSKHSSNNNNWFPYSKTLKVNILSSLLDSKFDLGEYINFLDENSMYTKEGFVDKILNEGYIQIKCKHNDGKIIKIHESRVYSAPIYLGFVIDLTDRIDVDKNLLLHCGQDDDDVVNIFRILSEIYTEYASYIDHDTNDDNNNNNEALRECDMISMGRFVSKNVIDFLFLPYYREPKIGCLVNESDGWISTKSYIHHCLNRHQLGIINNTSDVMSANLQELWSYCDICSIEVNRFDWVSSCNLLNVPNTHVICLNCVNNKIQQKEQLYYLLKELLNSYLYDDCIDQLVQFVVGRVVAHQPIDQ